MIWLVGLALISLLLAWAGAPYVPTHKADIKKLFDRLPDSIGTNEQKTFLDCGAGDGRLVRAAAQHGFKAVGYELNPIVFLVGWWYCRGIPNTRMRYGLWQQADLKKCSVVYMFGSKSNLARLVAKRPTGLIISYGFAPAKETDMEILENQQPFWFFKLNQDIVD
ncbi:TPA: hypothetical protein EYO12_00390 [Candidatus Saccharibacteria bacterium]|nr:hypothetical protein [Candidatus Saccharibacteria bacterium]HIO87553.1 hypothetical protein [Candidatus Saccharibacteria bacterium]